MIFHLESRELRKTPGNYFTTLKKLHIFMILAYNDHNPHVLFFKNNVPCSL